MGFFRATCLLGATVIATISLPASAVAAASRFVVVPANGTTSNMTTLAKERVTVQIRWAPYHSITVQTPDGDKVDYLQAEQTQSRNLNAPLSESSDFALSSGLILHLHPLRWEVQTQRYSFELAIDRDPAGDKEANPVGHKQTISGTLQKDESGRWLFVGESREPIYDARGELIAELSVGLMPESTTLSSPPVARRD